MPLADYTFYSGTFGGKLKEPEVVGLLERAGYYVDYYCFGRVTEKAGQLPESVLKAVKIAECAVVDMLNAQDAEKEANGDRIINSENIGDKSVSYAALTAEEALTYRRRQLYEIIRFYLVPTGLMYRGVDHASYTL